MFWIQGNVLPLLGATSNIPHWRPYQSSLPSTQLPTTRRRARITKQSPNQRAIEFSKIPVGTYPDSCANFPTVVLETRELRRPNIYSSNTTFAIRSHRITTDRRPPPNDQPKNLENSNSIYVNRSSSILPKEHRLPSPEHLLPPL